MQFLKVFFRKDAVLLGLEEIAEVLLHALLSNRVLALLVVELAKILVSLNPVIGDLLQVGFAPKLITFLPIVYDDPLCAGRIVLVHFPKLIGAGHALTLFRNFYIKEIVFA